MKGWLKEISIICKSVHPMYPEHDLVKFLSSKTAPKGYCVLVIRNDIPDEVFQFISELCEENFKRVTKDAPQWFVKSDECEAILHTIDENLEHEDSEDEESDDELIQAALARRFKSESSGKHITEEQVDDSEDEDVVSLSRRLRHLYGKVADLTKRVNDVENNKKK
jgi:hypothetical protein